ncbi:pyridoxamine 5'-phosphate oxidase family protein [Streptomyces griseus]|uniref:pyridoxamine 5'-phosphate oxidase family protein n=1 Tax=Streptomyces griseus TaxID=1911 RepID=UPI002D21B996|nr:pyridoxamine 5'-phosphate oxidase family protein [Streptomyces griseus]
MVIALSGTPKALPERTDDYKKLWSEYQPCTLTTLRPAGGPHMAPVGVTIDPATGIVELTDRKSSRKVADILAGGDQVRVAVCQVDGGRWAALEVAAPTLPKSQTPLPVTQGDMGAHQLQTPSALSSRSPWRELWGKVSARLHGTASRAAAVLLDGDRGDAVLARWHGPQVRLRTVPGPVADQVLRLLYGAAGAALVARRPGVGKESGIVMDAARLGVPLLVPAATTTTTASNSSPPPDQAVVRDSKDPDRQTIAFRASSWISFMHACRTDGLTAATPR